MEFNFKGKKALVTGGGSGLGRECALLFAKGGADVLIADLLPERCEAVANEVRALGRNAIAYPVDVTNYEQVAAMYKKIVEEFKPLFAENGTTSNGKVCIGTVQGDLHDIGKNLVKMMMEGKGLEVVDLGTDVCPENFVKTAIEENCQVICCSALLTTTMGVMSDVVKAAEAACAEALWLLRPVLAGELEKNGMRNSVKVMIGGAPVSEEFCREIGADAYCADAASAADTAVALCRA